MKKQKLLLKFNKQERCSNLKLIKEIFKSNFKIFETKYYLYAELKYLDSNNNCYSMLNELKANLDYSEDFEYFETNKKIVKEQLQIIKNMLNKETIFALLMVLASSIILFGMYVGPLVITIPGSILFVSIIAWGIYSNIIRF
jgi:hypothetical protein